MKVKLSINCSYGRRGDVVDIDGPMGPILVRSRRAAAVDALPEPAAEPEATEPEPTYPPQADPAPQPEPKPSTRKGRRGSTPFPEPPTLGDEPPDPDTSADPDPEAGTDTTEEPA